MVNILGNIAPKDCYKLVAGLIALPIKINFNAPTGEPSADSLLSSCERLFNFVPETLEHRQKPMRFASSVWVYQDRVSTNCPTCNNQSLMVFRKHLKMFAKDMHYWGIVCSVCKDARDSKDFDKHFTKQINLELEKSSPIVNICRICISKSKNY